jgi:GNAT superfamily N-acetyltransferase
VRVPAIRSATPADVAALAALKRATFRETFLEGFAIPYPPADIARFEAEHYGEARVAADLAAPDHHSWLAEGLDGTPVAYAHVGPCKLPHGDVQAGDAELYQLYMRADWQGGGLGRVLMERALGWLDARSPDRQWLGVWSGNVRAQRFYAHFGFGKVGTYDFAVGDHRDHEYIFRRG